MLLIFQVWEPISENCFSAARLFLMRVDTLNGRADTLNTFSLLFQYFFPFPFLWTRTLTLILNEGDTLNVLWTIFWAVATPVPDSLSHPRPNDCWYLEREAADTLSSWLFETLRPETENSQGKHTCNINQAVYNIHTGRKDKLSEKGFLAAAVVIQSGVWNNGLWISTPIST